MNDFNLVVNKMPRGYGAPRKRKLNREHATEVESGKSLVHEWFTALQVEKHATEVENGKSLVHELFTALQVEKLQKKREHHLLAKT